MFFLLSGQGFLPSLHPKSGPTTKKITFFMCVFPKAFGIISILTSFHLQSLDGSSGPAVKCEGKLSGSPGPAVLLNSSASLHEDKVEDYLYPLGGGGVLA